MDFSHSSVRTARIQHWCRECHRDILPGQRYVRVRSVSGDRWFTDDYCCPCDQLNDELWALNPHWYPDDGPRHGELVEWAEPSVNKLSPASQGHYYGLLWLEREQAQERRSRGHLGRAARGV